MSDFLAPELKHAISTYQNTVMACVRDGDLDKAKLYLKYPIDFVIQHRNKIQSILPCLKETNHHLLDSLLSLESSDDINEFIDFSRKLESITKQ